MQIKALVKLYLTRMRRNWRVFFFTIFLTSVLMCISVLVIAKPPTNIASATGPTPLTFNTDTYCLHLPRCVQLC